MSLALLTGAAFGAGVVLLARALVPARPPLAMALARLDRPAPRPVVDSGAEHANVTSRLGAWAAALVTAPGPTLRGVRADLAVIGRSAEAHLGEKVALGLGGLLLAPATAALMAAGGVAVPAVVPVWASLALAAGGFFVPDLTARTEAAARRGDFRHALGSFLDLVVISLAGGGGVETALADAAAVGTGWGYAQLRRALTAAQVTRESPWVVLGALGDELGVGELTELAATLGLAGTEGARVRESLLAKARALRAHQLAEAEAEAAGATERMSLPVVLLFVGFIVFIGFPAVMRVVHGI